MSLTIIWTKFAAISLFSATAATIFANSFFVVVVTNELLTQVLDFGVIFRKLNSVLG